VKRSEKSREKVVKKMKIITKMKKSRRPVPMNTVLFQKQILQEDKDIREREDIK